MKQNSPKHRTIARKAAHLKASKQTSQDIDLNQLIERLTRLRFDLQTLIIDASNEKLVHELNRKLASS